MIMTDNEKNRLSRKRFLSSCALEMCVLSLSSRENSFVNALSGVVFGGLAALVGIYVILDSIK